jgi:hypothetical protein
MNEMCHACRKAKALTVVVDDPQSAVFVFDLFKLESNSAFSGWS